MSDLVVENNSNQPIHDFHAIINPGAFCSPEGKTLETKDGKEIKIASTVGWGGTSIADSKPLKMIPPGKWIISLDFTESGFQGVSLLDSFLRQEKADYVPVIRTSVDAVNSYEFKDNMRIKWRFECSKNEDKLIKVGKERAI